MRREKRVLRAATVDFLDELWIAVQNDFFDFSVFSEERIGTKQRFVGKRGSQPNDLNKILLDYSNIL